MIIDGALQFTGTAGTVPISATSCDSPTTGTQTSTNVIDLLNARDMGIGDDPSMKILATVFTTFTGGTNLQLTVQLSVDNSTWVTAASGPVVVEANLLQGTHLLDLDVPRLPGAFGDHPGGMQGIPRYLRLQYVSSGTHGAGALFASIVIDRQDMLAYPPGIVIAN